MKKLLLILLCLPLIGFGQKIELINYLNSCTGIEIIPADVPNRNTWVEFKTEYTNSNLAFDDTTSDTAILCKYLSDYMYKNDMEKMNYEVYSYMKMLGNFGYNDTIIDGDTLGWLSDADDFWVSQNNKIEIWGLDYLLNKYYIILKILMTKEEFKLIKESQISWIDFRDKEYQTEGIRFKNKSRWNQDGYNFSAELYSNRVEQLYFYISSTDYFIMNCK